MRITQEDANKYVRWLLTAVIKIRSNAAETGNEDELLDLCPRVWNLDDKMALLPMIHHMVERVDAGKNITPLDLVNLTWVIEVRGMNELIAGYLILNEGPDYSYDTLIQYVSRGWDNDE